MKINKKAFTLIELVSVLVILAILALIVTPLVLNIIKKARTADDKRSIDAYGRSIELAIADYLLENGTFPTSIEELQIEYSGDRVECANKGINEDATIYLTDCTVNGRIVTGYAYGRYGAVSESENKTYSVGDEVRYNNVDYYVIKNSEATEDTVTLLKKEPLLYEEVGKYLNGTELDVSDMNNYGSIKYHNNSSRYSTSYVKVIVDMWAAQEVLSGLEEARLITFDELTNDLGYTYGEVGTSMVWHPGESTPSWVYNSNYLYWTMTPPL